MTVTFFFNYLNHHQVLVADEMYKLLGNDFHFVATYSRNPAELKGGVDYSNRSYCILATETVVAKNKADELNRTSDVCVFGAGNLDYVVERSKTGKLSFEVSERWLKKGLINIFSPRLLRWWWVYQTRLRKKPFYKLCASAYAAKDDKLLGCYENKHFKWGYFTAVSEESYCSTLKSSSDIVLLIWVARFIDWKHPELAIDCAQKLKKEGYKFILNMYGDGKLRPKMESLVYDLGLEDVIKFHGNVSNYQIQQAMKESDICLFTSDRQEGWGAVANEAMAARCCLIGNQEIGAVPYLIIEGKNGLTYKNGSSSDLFNKIKLIINNPEQRKLLAEQGYNDVINYWSPKKAAENLLQLIMNMLSGSKISIEKGPCSIA